MHSRAFLLLKRDLINLQRIPIEGITGGPSREDAIYHWKARIEGLKGTIWENGVFQISLTFSDDYNVLPPSVQFMTIPYHPNVHPKTGVPSFGLLNEEWNESHSVSSLLLSLQVLMSNPELDSGCILNHEAEKCYKDTPHTYNQMALDCVTASQRIEAGLTPYSSKRTISCPNSQPSLVTKSSSQEQQRQFKKIPFDDYHVLWQGLATSVPVYNPNNKFMQLLDRDDYLRQVHFETEYHKNLDLQKRTEEHLRLKYGVSKRNDKHKPTNLKEKNKRIADLTSLYTAHHNKDLIESSHHHHDNDMVDELLAWTTSLDENKLEDT